LRCEERQRPADPTVVEVRGAPATSLETTWLFAE